MSLRRRISLVAASAVAVAVGIAVLISYFAVKNQLLGQIDNELRAQAALIQARYEPGAHAVLPGLAAAAGGSAPYYQVVSPRGAVLATNAPGGQAFPAGNAAASVATGTAPAYISTVSVAGARLRMYTFNVTPQNAFQGMTSFAVQLARPLAATDNVLGT